MLSITPKPTKNKDELPAARIHRQCNPRYLEVAFLSEEAINFFAHDQLSVLKDRYLASGEGLTTLDAAVINGRSEVPATFRLKDIWMFGCTKPTGEITAVARTPLCRYHLGLGIYNVQVAVEGMEGNKKNHLLHLCGKLLRLVLIPFHIDSESQIWIRTTALSFAAELDGHVLGTLCAVTMALLTNRLDLCIQGLFGAGKSKSMVVLLLALLELDDTENLKILFLCKENSGTRSFADLLLWLQPAGKAVRRIGRIVGDQERNKSSYSQTRFDIHPRERKTMINKCQIVLATGGTVAQDLTMQWSAMGGFMQELSLMVIDEGQQYGTDREIAVISLLQQQPLIIWTWDAEQTPGGIARTAPNAKRSRQLLLAKKHGLRSARKYCTPATLANAMTAILSSSSNDQLAALANTLDNGEHSLGQMWTDDLSAKYKQDLTDCQQLLPGATGIFREATTQERARRPSVVDPELLDGNSIDFRRSLVRLAYILQHAATLHPMAGDLQATLNSETSGINNIHAWGLMLPSSSRVSPVTYHAVVAVRYPGLCREVNGGWELGSFASGGIPTRPPGFQMVLWDTNPSITGLVAADLEAIVGEIIPDFADSIEYADGLFVMTTATDHKNNLNRTGLKRDNLRRLRVETIANSAGGTAQVAIVAQPSTGFLNGRFYADKTPTEDTEDCLGRTTVGLTRSKSLTILVSPLDMLGLMGMAQVVATIAYGIRGLRTGETTWSWPDFHSDPTQENLAQIQRWSLNQAPDWTYPPLAIANQYRDRHTKEIKRERYRLILVRGYELDWLRGDLLRRTREENGKSNWIPKQELPFTEIVLYAYAADCTPYPTYVMLPTGLHKARTGALVPRQGPHQEIIPLPGIYFFDGWRVEPSLKIPDNLPQTQDMPVRITARAPAQGAAPRQAPEDEARDILAAAAKNQIECGPGTRRAAVRAIKYLRTLVHKHGATINEIHTQARLHTQKSKGVIEPGKWYQPTGEALPVISKEVTSELLHCLSALPDPWPLAKITIDLEKPGQWVTKMARLYFSDYCARRTDRIPNKTRGTAVEEAMEETATILPKLEARMIEFLAEWLVSLLMPAQGVLEARAPHLSFMLKKDYWFREIYLGLKVTASFGRSESYTRVVDGQVRCITPDSTSQQLQVVWNVQYVTAFIPAWMVPPIFHSVQRSTLKSPKQPGELGHRTIRPTWFEDDTSLHGQKPAPPQDAPQEMHGLKLMIREEIMPQDEMPSFPALAHLAESGFLAPDAWNCRKLQVSLKVAIDVPMLGTIIETNGDNLEDSHMPTGWPLLIDGAVRQCCVHRYSTIQDMQDMLTAYDLSKNSVEINRDAPQWTHFSVWNRKYMDPVMGNDLRHMWQECEPAIGRKIKASYDIRAEDIRRIAAFVTTLPPPSAPESPFFLTLGTPAQQQCPPLNSTLAQRTQEEWARTLCENKAVAIIQGMQEGKPALIPKECEEILIAIVLDRPLTEAQRLVENPERFFNEILDALDTHRNHPVLTQLLLDIAEASTTSTASQPSGQQAVPTMQFQ